tara:strand:+ start:354 stop:1004 length:651 start_codon:yes stop_codon:yes gene_type:complete
MVDLTGVDGLSEEQTAKLSALFDSEIGGLKNKVDELIGEKRNVQQTSTEKDQIIEDARKAAVTAEEQRLVESGRYKEALELREKETIDAIATANASTKTAQDALQSRDYGTSSNNLLGMFHDSHKEVGEALLSKGLKVGYNDQHQPVTTFEYGGEVVATGIDEIKGWAGEQSVFKQYLKGVDSSGADTTQSRGSSATSGNDTQNRLAQRLKQANLT